MSALFQKAENLTIIRTVRNGLISMIPVLIIGAFSLILQTFPVEAYQNAISFFLGGFFLRLFQVIYSATFGTLSVFARIKVTVKKRGALPSSKRERTEAWFKKRIG